MNWPSDGEPRSDTAPLARDNSRIAPASTAQWQPAARSGPNPAPSAHAEGVTHAAFAQPQHPTGSGQHSAMPSHTPPDHGPHQPFEPAPYEQAPPEPPTQYDHGGYAYDAGPAQAAYYDYQPEPERPRVSAMGWFGRGLALVAVSVASGAVWLAVKSGGGQDESQQNPGPTTKHQFSSVMTVNGAQGCAQVSEGKIKKFFAKHPCQHLTRALYTTQLPNGQKVLTSVNTVLMADPNVAAQLNATATGDDTGNIKDLVDQRAPGTEHYPKLSDNGYASQPQGAMVAIGDSAYFGQKTSDKDPQLAEITKDALNLAWKQNQTQ